MHAETQRGTASRRQPGRWTGPVRAIAWLLLVAPLCHAADPVARIEFVYAGHRFSVPAGFAAMGASGNETNFVAFRFGSRPGERYLAFSDLSHEADEKYGCAAADFFASAFGNSIVGSCRAGDIAAFREQMLAGHPRGTWKGKDTQVHHVQHGTEIYLFLLGGNRRLLQIDSDFLDRAAMKQVLAGYVD